jgi:hypothetical protein
MSTPDQETLLRAVEDARRILGEYIEPGQRDAGRTVQRLLAVLDTNDVVHALDRMKRRRVMHWSNDHLPEASQGRLLRTRRSRSILQHCPQRYLMRSSPSPSGAIVSSFIVLAQTIQEMSVTSGLWSSFIVRPTACGTVRSCPAAHDALASETRQRCDRRALQSVGLAQFLAEKLYDHQRGSNGGGNHGKSPNLFTG